MKKPLLTFFHIVLLLSVAFFAGSTAYGQTVRHGNSYVNISKKTVGGVVEPGDTLEIRMTIHLTAGTIYRVRYLDSVPSFTEMLTTTNDSLRIITNEGLTYKKYTLDAGDDAGTYLATPPAGDYQIRMNLGLGTNNPGAPANTSLISTTNTMSIQNSQRPRVWNGVLFATAFRVVVTGSPGDVIQLGAGKFLYTNSSSGGSATNTLTATPYRIMISDPISLCNDNVGANFAGEDGGTFGNGTPLHRSYGPTVSIPGYNYRTVTSTTQSVGDGEFSIVKNMSPTGSGFAAARRVPNCNVPSSVPDTDPLSCRNRMHNGHWDIAGDHTGTSDQDGNIAPALANNGGYMLMVNSDYVASEAYRQTISGLCPGTYYEFSAWVKNICLTCGADSTATSNYLPGVNPNLTFVMNDTDRYSTGELMYEQGWIKKGFVFKTRDNQTSITFSIRNNAQGGGGNDWVMDDIAIATCLPTMSYSPSLNPSICEGNPITIYDTIRSYFDNYSHYLWQRSTDDGNTWSDIGSINTATPAATGNGYQYITSHTIPPSTVADSGHRYRVIVATTPENLSNPDCQVTDGISIITLTVRDCTPVLTTSFLSFQAKLISGSGQLHWTTSREEIPITYQVERSTDGINYVNAGMVYGLSRPANNVNEYTYTDRDAITGKVYYRIMMLYENKKKYSRSLQLNQYVTRLTVATLINPFYQSLEFDIQASENTKIHAELIDIFGKVVRKKNFLINPGTTNLRMEDTEGLPPGNYIFRLYSNGEVITRKVMKSVR